MNDPKSGGGPMGQRKPLEWPPSTLIENPSENDVLFGRGAPFIRWKGNVRFRQVVSQWRSKYLGTRRHIEKSIIASKIIDEIRVSHGGRFLIKYEQQGIDNSCTLWVQADENTIIEKVKQTLRDKKQGDTPGGRIGRKSSANSAGCTRRPPFTREAAIVSQTHQDEDPWTSIPAHRDSPTSLCLPEFGILQYQRCESALGQTVGGGHNATKLGRHIGRFAHQPDMIHRDRNRVSAVNSIAPQQEQRLNLGVALYLERDLHSRRLELLHRMRIGDASLAGGASIIMANRVVNTPSGENSLARMIRDEIPVIDREQQILGQFRRIADSSRRAIVPNYAGVNTEDAVANDSLPSLGDSQLLQQWLLLSGRSLVPIATRNSFSLPTTLGTAYNWPDILQRGASGLHLRNAHNGYNANTRVSRCVGYSNATRPLPPISPNNEAEVESLAPECPPQQEQQYR